MRKAGAVLLVAVCGCGGDPNMAPEAVGTIPDLTVHVGDSAVVSGIGGYFSDVDGDVLEFAVTSSAPGTVAASLAGTGLTLAALAKGEAEIALTATDP